MSVSFAVRMPSVFLPVSTAMVTETARMALMNRTVQLLLVQETSFCVPKEGQAESLDAFSVHRCVMAKRTVRIQQMRKLHVVSITEKQVVIYIIVLFYCCERVISVKTHLAI